MHSSYFPSHPLLPSLQSLFCDGEQHCLTLLDEQKHIKRQLVMSGEEIAFFADLLAAYPHPLAASPEYASLDLAQWNSRLCVLSLRLEALPSGYRLASCFLDVAPHPNIHPHVYMQLDWRRGMLTIPPFLR